MNKDTLFDALEYRRSENNAPWLRILRLAFDANPEEACKAAEEIIDRDRQIDEILWCIIREYRGE